MIAFAHHKTRPPRSRYQSSQGDLASGSRAASGDPSLIKAALPPVKTRPRRDGSSGNRRRISRSSRKHISRRSGNWAANGRQHHEKTAVERFLLVLLSARRSFNKPNRANYPKAHHCPMHASAVPDNLRTDISGRRGGGGGHIGGRPGGGHGHFGRPGGGRPGGGVGRPGSGRPGHIGRPGGVETAAWSSSRSAADTDAQSLAHRSPRRPPRRLDTSR